MDESGLPPVEVLEFAREKRGRLTCASWNTAGVCQWRQPVIGPIHTVASENRQRRLPEGWVVGTPAASLPSC